MLTAPLCESTELIKELTQSSISIVGVATGYFAGNITCIGIDDFKAAYEMTNYLIGLRHKRIGFVKGHPRHTSSTARARGYEAALRDARDAVEKPMIAQGYYSNRSGLIAAEELLSGTNVPTAIFASNDDMASAVTAVAWPDGFFIPA